MRDFFAKAGLRLSANQIEKLQEFFDFFQTKNATKILSSIQDPQEVLAKHFLDSVFPTTFCEFPASIMDLGSGGGFPGIPLKIVLEKPEVILAEERREKAAFLQEACSYLRLKGLRVFPERVTTEKYPGKVHGITTRALEPIEKTLRRAEAYLVHGGKVFFWKGREPRDELAAFSRNKKLSKAFRMTLEQHYELPILGHERTFYVFERR